MASSQSKCWFGPLSSSPKETRERLEATPSLRALMKRGWSPEMTLLYVPPTRDGYHLGIAVVGRTFGRDERSRVVWVFSTIGLCAAKQSSPAGRASFQHFELVLATNNAERDDPFPSRLGVVLSMGSSGLPGWDWSQVTAPPLLDWLTIVGEEVGAAIRQGSQFALYDILTLGPGHSGSPRSRLTHSLFLPVSPPLLAVGFEPFSKLDFSTGVISTSEWNRDPGNQRFDHGFYWLLPVSEREYNKANAEGSWSVFAELAKLGPEGGDECSVAFDLLREG